MSGQDITPADFPGWGLYDSSQCALAAAATAAPATTAPVAVPEQVKSDQTVCKKELAPHMTVHCKKSNCMPSPFAPHGGAAEWQTNELIMRDPCLRSLARVSPLDCNVTNLYRVNPTPPKY